MSRLLVLVSLTIFLRPQEDINVMDVGSVPELKSQSIERVEKVGSAAPKIVSRYDSLFTFTPSPDWDSKRDLTAQYKRLYPYPEMRYIPLKQFNATQKEPGIKRVEGFRRHWDRTNTGYDVKEDEIWRWEAPKALQNCWVISTNHSSSDRFMALVLRPTGTKPHNPIISYFDSEKGLIWQKEIPLKSTYASVKNKVAIPPSEVESKYPDSRFEDTIISKDGSKIIVIIPYQQPCLSLMFVYDNEGNLLKTATFPQRFFVPRASFVRTPQGNHLILRFDHRYDTVDAAGKTFSHRATEDYLADFDGNLLCRFNKPVDGSQYAPAEVSSGDDYASILDFQKHERHIYSLPK